MSYTADIQYTVQKYIYLGFCDLTDRPRDYVNYILDASYYIHKKCRLSWIVASKQYSWHTEGHIEIKNSHATIKVYL